MKIAPGKWSMLPRAVQGLEWTRHKRGQGPLWGPGQGQTRRPGQGQGQTRRPGQGQGQTRGSGQGQGQNHKLLFILFNMVLRDARASKKEWMVQPVFCIVDAGSYYPLKQISCNWLHDKVCIEPPFGGPLVAKHYIPKENVATENTAPYVSLHSSQSDQESTSWLCISLGRTRNQKSYIELFSHLTSSSHDCHWFAV